MKTTAMQTIIGELNIIKADQFLSRLKGLLFTNELHEHSCMLIVPCGSVHTIGMKYPINVLFLSHNNEILGIKMHLSPNRFCVGPPSTKKVVELSTELDLILSNIIGKKFVEGEL